nr:MAG TPA: major capsid protein [Caudoviricetes sp.]
MQCAVRRKEMVQMPNQIEVNQIYDLCNQIFQQMTGRTDIAAVDSASLVAMGNEVSNLGKNDLWLNTLARRIGLTIDNYRVYLNKFSDLYRTQVEWGALVQKLTVEMPDAVADDMYKVGQLNGQALDHYIINNPKAKQKIFDKETPYSFFITMQEKMLTEAFLNAGAMASFVNQVFGKVQNKIEVVLEDLARVALVNMMCNISVKQEIKLVTLYNSKTGSTLNPQTALFDPTFMRFAIGMMNNIASKMETMSVLFNTEGYDRFTPKSEQRFYVLADFITQLETVVQYAAFNPQYVNKSVDIAVPYWQGVKEGDDINDIAVLSKVIGKVDNKVDKTIENVVGVLFDREAIGTFRQEEKVLTTPVNARGAYYNTFWHEKQMWFNDMSENVVIFTLN